MPQVVARELLVVALGVDERLEVVVDRVEAVEPEARAQEQGARGAVGHRVVLEEERQLVLRQGVLALLDEEDGEPQVVVVRAFLAREPDERVLQLADRPARRAVEGDPEDRLRLPDPRPLQVVPHELLPRGGGCDACRDLLEADAAAHGQPLHREPQPRLADLVRGHEDLIARARSRGLREPSAGVTVGPDGPRGRRDRPREDESRSFP